MSGWDRRKVERKRWAVKESMKGKKGGGGGGKRKEE